MPAESFSLNLWGSVTVMLFFLFRQRDPFQVCIDKNVNTTVQNCVKRGFLPPPQNKRYTMEQTCRIILINMLKGTLALEQITHMLSYVNGNLADDSDDLIDDAVLYFMFVRLAARSRHIGGTEQWDEAVESVLTDYREPVPGAKERVRKVLRTMLTAWVANRLRMETEEMLKNLT